MNLLREPPVGTFIRKFLLEPLPGSCTRTLQLEPSPGIFCWNIHHEHPPGTSCWNLHQEPESLSCPFIFPSLRTKCWLKNSALCDVTQGASHSSQISDQTPSLVLAPPLSISLFSNFQWCGRSSAASSFRHFEEF